MQGPNPGAGFAGGFALDAETFELLLSAAFVMQQQNDRVRSVAVAEAPPSVSRSLGVESPLAQLPLAAEQEPRENSAVLSGDDVMHLPDNDLSQILEKIAETQREIQARQLPLQKALELVCACAMDTAHAQGAAIGLLEDEDLVYRAGCGTGAREIGRRVKAQWSLPAECLLYGDTLFCPELEPSSPVDVELCRQREAQSVVAVPIYSEGSVRGALELTASKPGAFRSHTVRAAELLAGMVTEALARAREAHWRQSLAEERNLMLTALEQLRPQLELLAQAKQNQQGPSSEASIREASQTAEPARTDATDDLMLPGDGSAGAEAPSVGVAPDEVPSLQTTSDDVPPLQTTAEEVSAPQTTDATTANADAVPPLPLPPVSHCSVCGVSVKSGAQRCELCTAEKARASDSRTAATSTVGTAEKSATPEVRDRVERIKSDGPLLATSALEKTPATPLARDQSSPISRPLENWNPSFMQKPDTAASRLWDRYWRAISLVLLLILLVALASWLWYGLGYAVAQNQVVSHTSFVPADLPPAPVYLGNPASRVWEDRKNALYYCSDDPKYGKTERGRFAPQSDAQLLKLEPAQGKPCE